MMLDVDIVISYKQFYIVLFNLVIFLIIGRLYFQLVLKLV